MKNKIILLTFVFVFILSNLSLVYGDVGVGISPSKMILEIEAGKSQQLDILVYNTGDNTLDVTMDIDGEIQSFTKIEKNRFTIEPEPKPHEFPIKNGVHTTAVFSPPGGLKPKTYKGMISAGGGPYGGQFGGRVSVASQIEIIVRAPKSIFSYITTTHLLIVGIVILLALIIWFLKRMGLKFRFEKDPPSLQQ